MCVLGLNKKEKDPPHPIWGCERSLLYEENHSLGEWFKRRLLPIMRTIKTPFAKIEVRSGNCTNKQREVIQNERQ